MKRLLPVLCIVLCLSGCGEDTVTPTQVSSSTVSVITAETLTEPESPQSTPSVTLADTHEMDLTFEKETTSSASSSKKPVDITSLPTTKPSQNTNAPETLNIQKGGDYVLTGMKQDAMVTVDAGEDTVNLTLSGVTVTNTKGPALYIRSAGKVNLILAEGTTNTLSDGTSYTLTDDTTTLDATLFSRADLTIKGAGVLTVNGNYKHGIVSKDDLVLSSGTYHVTSKNVAIEGKDCVKINQGNFTLNAGTDGIRSNNTQDPNKGFIYLYGGSFTITAGNDGVQAQTLLKVEKGSLAITTGGGSENTDTATGSFKGLKAGSDIRLSNGTFVLNTKDDCIHSDGTVTLSGGQYTLSSGNDGVRATTDLALTGGTFTLLTGKDGIQATNIVISGGKATLTVSQSGIQAKGDYRQTGGDITVFGTHGSGKGVLNYAGTATVEGGTLMALGDSAKAQHLTGVKNQCAVCFTFPSQPANSTLVLQQNGKTVVSASSAKGYSMALLSAPDLTQGEYILQLQGKTVGVTVNKDVFTATLF
ncbi:MAG: carbohydrate-binding domain-containing protein [Clostridia bacterium]|nr:carbohydrate-binding domain-containing protein [Clostridia bacterium]